MKEFRNVLAGVNLSFAMTFIFVCVYDSAKRTIDVPKENYGEEPMVLAVFIFMMIALFAVNAVCLWMTNIESKGE